MKHVLENIKKISLVIEVVNLVSTSKTSIKD